MDSTPRPSIHPDSNWIISAAYIHPYLHPNLLLSTLLCAVLYRRYWHDIFFLSVSYNRIPAPSSFQSWDLISSRHIFILIHLTHLVCIHIPNIIVPISPFRQNSSIYVCPLFASRSRDTANQPADVHIGFQPPPPTAISSFPTAVLQLYPGLGGLSNPDMRFILHSWFTLLEFLEVGLLVYTSVC